jgi:hypothetical protein
MENIDNAQENIDENSASEEESEEEIVHEPKQNYVIYTIISILLFCVLYFGWQFVSSKMFRDYTITVTGENFTAEQISIIGDFTSISCDNISQAVYTRTNGKASVVIYYEDIGDTTQFVDNCINYEYGDVEEDVQTAIYPYGNSVPEYVYAEQYVDIDDPNRSTLVYDYNGSSYAEYHSSDVNTEIRSLFNGGEKIYE